MPSVEIVSVAPGCIAVHGALTFETARDAHEAGLRLIESATTAEIEVNCAQVSEADSAGLVVLLDWLAAAHRREVALRFEHVPDALCAVARISEIEDLLRTCP